MLLLAPTRTLLPMGVRWGPGGLALGGGGGGLVGHDPVPVTYVFEFCGGEHSNRWRRMLYPAAQGL